MIKYTCITLLIYGCFANNNAIDTKKDLEKIITSPSNPGARTESKMTRTGQPVDPNMSKWRKFYQGVPNKDERIRLTKKLEFLGQEESLEKLIEVARIQKAVGQLMKSEATYLVILRRFPENINSLLEIAHLYLMKNEISKCLSFLNRFKDHLKKVSDQPDLIITYQYTKSLALLKQGHYESAHQILRNILKSDISFIPGYSTLGTSYLNRGKLKIAEFIVQRGLNQDKDNPTLINLLGVIFLHQNQQTKANIQFQRALNLNPDFAPSLVNRANMAIKRKEFLAAENDLKKALSINHIFVHAYVSLGILQKETGRFKEAQASFAQALSIDPENAYARFNLALLTADQLKDTSTALQLFHEVLQTYQPNDQLKDLSQLHIDGLRENRISQ